jgi:sugar phosphate permease
MKEAGNMPEKIEAAPIEEQVLSYRWIILILAILTYTMSFLSRFSWPPLVPVVVPVLNINMTEAGSYMTAFYIGYVITQVPAGIIGDRFGVRIMLTGTLILQAVACVSLSFINTFQTGFFIRILAGMAGGCVYAGCFRAMVQWFPLRQRAMAFGFLMATPSLGSAASNAIAPILESFLGWRGVFQAIAGLSIIIAVFVVIMMKDSPPKPVEKNTADAGKPKEKPIGVFAGLKYVFTDRNIMILTLGSFCGTWYQIGFGSWGNTFLKNNLQFSLQQAGAIMTSFGIVGALLSPLSGYIAGRTGKALAMIIVAQICNIVGVLSFGQMSSIGGIIVSTVIVGCGVGLMNPLYVFLTSAYSNPKLAGTVGGATNFLFQLAGIAVPIVTGWAIDITQSFGVVWWIIAAAPFTALITLFLLKNPQATGGSAS